LGFFCLSIIQAAPALVMTFDAATDRMLATDDYVENGIRMSVATNHYDIGHNGDDGYANIDTYPRVENCAIRFELDGGGLFYLESIELTCVPVFGGEPAFANYAFEFSDGSSFIPQPVQGPVVLEAEIVSLPALTYFVFSISPPFPGYPPDPQRNAQLDNITLTAIPEPATSSLLAVGLAVMVARGRRQAELNR
jgi:hypothetical protein